jgi:MutS domain V
MAPDPRTEYEARLERWSREIARCERASLSISNGRLVVAAVTAFLAWQAFVSFRLAPIWPIVSALGFAVLAIVHARVLRRIERARRAHQLYERGMARLDARWAGLGADGARFLETHPFARDVDLFGPASLFQLLNTARTEIGEETLAAWIGSGAALGEVRARQLALEELRPKVDFREDLAVLAAEAHVGRTGPLATWGATAPIGFSRFHASLFGACALASLAVTGLVLAESVPSTLLVAWILAQSAIVAVWRHRINTVASRIDTAAHDLALMASLVERVEREPFVSPRLRAIGAAFAVEGTRTSRRIARLQRLVSFLDQATLNPFFRPIGALVLVRSQMAVAVDRWHAANGTAIGTWLRAVGEVEALSSLATYCYEHPADPFPDLADTGAVFDATAVAHPLMDERSAVRNDVRLGESHPRVLIVSGSNMSGKSTLLRAVGLNLVLALAGAPVRASAVTLSAMSLGATMRIDDSLQAGYSRFYAEILRIRTIVDLAKAGPSLFLLDEILGGTNSYDRRIGAQAIIRALVDAGAIGLVTTHDLALTALASELSSKVANVHFEDRIENGTMVFDYRMRPGVVERSNALALMRAIGLDV